MSIIPGSKVKFVSLENSSEGLVGSTRLCGRELYCLVAWLNEAGQFCVAEIPASHLRVADESNFFFQQRELGS